MNMKHHIFRTSNVKRTPSGTKEGAFDRGIWVKMLFDDKTPTDSLAMGVVWIEPGSASPEEGYVKHDVEEAQLVLSGYGELQYQDGSMYSLEPSVALYHAAWIPHRIRNVSDEPLVLIFTYSSKKPARIPV